MRCRRGAHIIKYPVDQLNPLIIRKSQIVIHRIKTLTWITQIRIFSGYNRPDSKSSRGFSRFTSQQSYDLFDLRDFAVRIQSQLPNTSDALIQAVDDCVVCSVSNLSGARGLSFYYPLESPNLAQYYLAFYNNQLAPLGFAAGYAAAQAAMAAQAQEANGPIT